MSYARRGLFMLYSAVILAVALPVVVVIHAYRFADDLEEKWTLWLVDWCKRNKRDVP